MAPRDYKNRGRAAKKPQPAPAPAAKFGPKLIVLSVLTLLTLAAFGYFLWSLKTAEKPVQQGVNKPNNQQVEAELPEPPKSRWRYLEELKGREVEVEVPERKKSDKRYQMQCASFRSIKPAEQMRAKIAFLGLEAMIKTTDSSNGKKWHRVVLGPYPTSRDAAKDRHLLQNNRINGCKIWLWNW